MSLLKAKSRPQTGTRKVRALRKGGLIPAIIYGHGETPEPVSLDLHEILAAVHHGKRLLELDVDGKRENVLIKEVQYDALGDELLHVDLARVSLDERVEVTVPVVLRGTPAGAAEEGILHQAVSQVTIECLVTAIPDDIRASVEHMKVGDKLLMKELPLPEGARLLADPETTVATVTVIAEEVVAPVEGAVAEPEVIGEKKEEEAEGEAEGEAAAPKKEKEVKKEKEKE